MRINEIIREKRREKGLTQEQAAERLGVTASAVNKWERGASLPDITLLPALARLLGVDLNTLLDFSEELTDGEIGDFLNSLDAAVKSEGYSAVFGRAERKIQEYPSCEKLLLSAAYYLDGALFLYGVEGGGYREKLDGWYERLLESRDGEIREAAMAMVLNRCRQNGELERAEALLNSLPNTQIDRQEQLALLYAAQGRAEEARQLWQSRVLEGISRATTAMQHLANAALKEGRRDDAQSIARKVHCLTRAAGLPEWMGLSSLAAVAGEAGDAGEYSRLLGELRRSLERPGEGWDSLLYGALSTEGVSALTARLAEMLDREAENS